MLAKRHAALDEPTALSQELGIGLLTPWPDKLLTLSIDVIHHIYINSRVE